MRIAFVIAAGGADHALVAARAAVAGGHQIEIFADHALALPADAVRLNLVESFAERIDRPGYDYVIAVPGEAPLADFCRFVLDLAAAARLVLLDASDRPVDRIPDPDMRDMMKHGGLLLSPTRDAAAGARAFHTGVPTLRFDSWSPQGDFAIAAQRFDELLWRSFEALTPINPEPGHIALSLPAIVIPVAPTGFPLAHRPAGDGWSAGEEWGQWSIGAEARLAIELPEGAVVSQSIELCFTAAASRGGTLDQQGVVIQPSRGTATRLRLPRDVVFRDYRVTIARDAFRRGRTILEFRIDDPAPIRRDGEIVDHRMLGVAVSRLWLG